MAIGLKASLDYDDYCAIPPDGKRYELIDGTVHVTPAPSPLHQRVSKRLQRLLEAYFEAPGQGGEVFDAPIDVILTPHDVVQPDLVVVTNPALVSARGIEGPPHLVVEVLSPTTTAYDRTTKAQRYAALGIPHYWLVDPETRSVECFRRHEAAYQLVGAFGPDATLTHPDFPGLRFDLPALWR
jgi:Uma2 family endonuclease